MSKRTPEPPMDVTVGTAPIGRDRKVAVPIAAAPDLLARLRDLATVMEELMLDGRIAFEPESDIDNLALREMLYDAWDAIKNA